MSGIMNAVKPRLRLQFGRAIAIGPGKAELLELIAETGSISSAARRMNMSYRRAWLLVDTMNQCFDAPLVETAAGGKGGGGAHITDLGREVLARYRAILKKCTEAAADDFAYLSSHLAPTPPENPH